MFSTQYIKMNSDLNDVNYAKKKQGDSNTAESDDSSSIKQSDQILTTVNITQTQSEIIMSEFNSIMDFNQI